MMTDLSGADMDEDALEGETVPWPEELKHRTLAGIRTIRDELSGLRAERDVINARIAELDEELKLWEPVEHRLLNGIPRRKGAGK